MLLKKPPLLSPVFLTKQLNSQNNQAEQKHKNADTVNTVHIPNPFIFWPIRIFLFQVEVFRYLFPDSHIYITNFRLNGLKNKRGCLKSQFGCHIELIEILTIKLIAFDKLRLTNLLRQPHLCGGYRSRTGDLLHAMQTL